jgi:hypothetical protein
VSAPTVPVLDADLTAGLRRLKLAAMRQLAPELLVVAKTQRWSPEEVLRALVEAEIAARDASNERARLKAATFPVLEDGRGVRPGRVLDPGTDQGVPDVPGVGACQGERGDDRTGRHRQVPHPHRAGPCGRGRRALGEVPDRGRPGRDALPGLADNTVGKVIEGLLRNDVVMVDEVGFAPLDDTGAQLLFRFVAAACERRSLGLASHHSFEDWGRFMPEHTTAVSMLDRLLHHATTVVTNGQPYRMRQAHQRRGGEHQSQ